MFKFEVLVGTAGWQRILDKITDLASQGKEVHYEEAEGEITVTSHGRDYKIKGLIASGYAIP